MDLGVRQDTFGEAGRAVCDCAEPLHFDDINADTDNHVGLREHCRLDNMRRTMPMQVAGRIAWGVAAALWITAFIMNIVWEGWNWGVMDFVFATVYFSIAAGSVDLLSRRIRNAGQRRALIGFVVVILMLVWGMLATGD